MRQAMSEQSEQSDQQEAQGKSSKMAAAAAYYEQSQLPGGDTGPGRDNTFHGGQQRQSVMNVGDNTLFSFDNSDLSQLSMDSHQQPILNQNDNHYLSTFFDNPGIITSEFNPFDFSPSAEPRPATHGNASLFAGAFFDYNTGTINPHTPGAYQRNSGQPSSAALSADDYTAASTIHSLKATSSGNFQANPNGLGGASWGAFMMPQQMPLNISMGNAPVVGSNGQAPQQFFAHPQSMSIAPGTFPWQTQAQSSPHAAGATPRNMQGQAPIYPPNSTPQSGYGGPPPNRPPHFQPPQQNRNTQGGGPPPLGYGTDPAYRGATYSTPTATPQQDSKAGNLLGVPGAAQAARSPYQNGSLTTPQEQAAHWAAMNRRNGGDLPGPLGHKRRKSGENSMQLNTPQTKIEDGIYETFADGSSKRRRSSLTRPPEMSASPMLADAERAAMLRNHKRETLSDAQKRDNHIQSEKKRRLIINQGYDDLNRLVPCLASGKSGLSRSECLQEIACYLESLMRGTNVVLNRLGVSENDLKNYNPPPRQGPPQTPRPAMPHQLPGQPQQQRQQAAQAHHGQVSQGHVPQNQGTPVQGQQTAAPAQGLPPTPVLKTEGNGFQNR